MARQIIFSSLSGWVVFFLIFNLDIPYSGLLGSLMGIIVSCGITAIVMYRGIRSMESEKQATEINESANSDEFNKI